MSVRACVLRARLHTCVCAYVSVCVRACVFACLCVRDICVCVQDICMCVRTFVLACVYLELYKLSSILNHAERLLETRRNPALIHAGHQGRPKLCQFAVGVTAMDAVRTAFAQEQERPARIAFLRAVFGVTTL